MRTDDSLYHSQGSGIIHLDFLQPASRDFSLRSE
jgi:hypothetical protein